MTTRYPRSNASHPKAAACMAVRGLSVQLSCLAARAFSTRATVVAHHGSLPCTGPLPRVARHLGELISQF
eukprot:COSAG01_NODE_28629_length_656_cov_1.570916_1_plen_69_part_10